MKIKVYQITESPNLEYMPYNTVMKEIGRIDPEIYSTVFDGNVDCDSLEDIFSLLNQKHPVGYNGHSLSVSDIVETYDGCYFCDSIGFRELKSFDSTLCTPVVGNRMLVVEPHKVPYEMVIPDRLEPLQRAVDGYIECTYPFSDNAFVISNEEAKLRGMEGNRKINGQIFAGIFLIAADNGCRYITDLTDEQIAYYTEHFIRDEQYTQDEIEADMEMRFVVIK